MKNKNELTNFTRFRRMLSVEIGRNGMTVTLDNLPHPVILRGKVTDVYDGLRWLAITVKTPYGEAAVRTKNEGDRAKLFAWVNAKGYQPFSQDPQYAGLYGPGDVTFISPRGSLSELMFKPKAKGREHRTRLEIARDEAMAAA